MSADPLPVFLLPSVVGLSCLALLAAWRNKKTHDARLPTVRTLFPWLGLDNLVAWYRDPTKFMDEARERYGSFYMFDSLGSKVAILMQPYSLRQLERHTMEISGHLPIEMATKAASGIQDCGRIVDVILFQLIPIAAQKLSVPGLKESGLRAVFNREISIQLDKLLSIPTPSRGALPLTELICRPLYHATSVVLFGPTYPFHSYDDFMTLNSSIPFLASRLAKFPFSRPTMARKRLMKELIAYFAVWWDSDGEVKIEGISDLILEFLRACKGSGLTISESAAAVLGFTWGVHNNVWFHLYWLMSEVLVNEQTRVMIEEDARKHTEVPEMGLVNSVVWEALRWPFTIGQVRKASADLDITMAEKNYFIEKGTWIIPKNFNHDPAFYADPYEFKPDRFLVDLALPKPKTFGEGHHMCKGVQFATFEMPDFVAACFQKFDLRAAPQRNGQKPKMPAVRGNPFLPDVSNIEDFFVELKPRSYEKS